MKNAIRYRQMFESYGGIMRTKQLTDEKVFYATIQQLLHEGYIEKIKIGCYRWAENQNTDEAQLISQLFPDGILCMETALYHYRYFEEKPQEWHLAVSKDSGKSRFDIDFPCVKPHYVKPTLLELGIIQAEINGHNMKVYNRDRVICDCMRYRHKLDAEIFKKAVQAYVSDPQKNIPQLLSYAEPLRVKKYAQDLIGVWM